jgi:hypothetical protein
MTLWDLVVTSSFNLVTWGVFTLLSGASLLVLVYASERGVRLRPWVLRRLRWISGRSDLDWLDWQPVLVAAVIAFAAVATYGILTGQYGCHPPGVSDQVGTVNSGLAFWAGHDPFYVPDCGGHIQVPYGLAAVLIDAIGSLGGLPGIYAVWGLIAVSIVPLTWKLAGANRRQVMLYVGQSVLFVPLISSQIDGATNAIVPVTVLLSIYLARRNDLLGTAVGGFLSTARFPNIFPVLGSAGPLRRRYLAFGVGAGVFAAATGVAYVVWGSSFLGPVFFNQFARQSFSLNLYGVFLLSNTLPRSLLIEGAQALLILALLFAAFIWARTPLMAAAIVLAGFALLTPFLSFNILIWLLPIALVGARARWWLWGVAFVGSLNYDLALNVWAWDDGVVWPSAVLDVILTGLLIALFVELWREARRAPAASA